MANVIIVDKNDQPIGFKPRDQITGDDIYRVSGLWLTNLEGGILLAQRSFSKKNSPGKWGPAVAGTVEEGQTYESNIAQEIKEEIGLTGLEIKPYVKKLSSETNKPHFTQWFLAKADIDIADLKIQTDEVEAVRWISPADLVLDLKNNPDKYLVNMPKWVDLFIKPDDTH
jgi:isopentenyl-diphosphate delta-isomerase